MVKLRFVLPVLLIASACFAAEVAPPANLPDYQTGDRAVADVITPISLIVIDGKATEALRQKEIQRTPAIFRYDPFAADEAEASLRKAFANERRRFLRAVRATFTKTKLSDPDLSSPQFLELATVYRPDRKSFPFNMSLAQMWAKGDSDAAVQSEMIAMIRPMLKRYIIPNMLNGESKIGPAMVQIVPIPTNDAPMTLAMVEKRAWRVEKAKLITMSKARLELEKNSPTELQQTARFLAWSLKTNCFFDAELTQQSRAKKTDPLWAADHYEPGELIVKKGQMVNAKIKAALDQLKSRTAADQLRDQISREQSNSLATIQDLKTKAFAAESQAQAQAVAQKAQQRALLLWFGSVGALLLILVAFWRFRKPQQSTALVALQSGDAIAGSNWQVGTAEEIKQGLIPYLARMLREKLIYRLVSQRKLMLENQQVATAEIAHLDERLQMIQAPLEDRLKAYEKRIAELEKDLAEKGEQNRELIKAKILMTRKQLEAERGKNRLNWN